jgi:hypothetical protein
MICTQSNTFGLSGFIVRLFEYVCRSIYHISAFLAHLSDDGKMFLFVCWLIQCLPMCYTGSQHARLGTEEGLATEGRSYSASHCPEYVIVI